MIGFFFGLLDLVTPVVSGLVLAVWGLLTGASVGAAFGFAKHWFSRGRRDFFSVKRLEPRRYDVVAEGEVAEQARGTLAHVGVNGHRLTKGEQDIA